MHPHEIPPPWRGNHTPYQVGEPGRAPSRVFPQFDHRVPFRSDIVVDATRLVGPYDKRRHLDVRAASIRGLSHRHYGTTRQDEFAMLVSADRRRLVVGVADGLSSATLSHVAAQIVARDGCALVARELDTVDPAALNWLRILDRLADAVVDCGVRDYGLPPDRRVVTTELAATALFAVVDIEPNDDGARSVRLMALGDSSAWLLRPGETIPWQPLCQVVRTDVITSTSTFAVPALPADIGDPVSAELDAGEVLVLMTDGVGDPLGTGVGDVGAFLAHEWVRPPTPLAFAAQADFARITFDDDRTVVAIWPGTTP
jgi:serine/threonine protein phosphatase PrpC